MAALALLSALVKPPEVRGFVIHQPRDARVLCRWFPDFGHHPGCGCGMPFATGFERFEPHSAGYQENCATFSEPHRLTPSGWSIFIPHARWDIPRYHTWCVLNIFGCKITGLQDFFQLWHQQLGDPSRPRWSRTSTATWGSWQINLTRGSINPAFCSACFAFFYGPCAYTRRSDEQRSSFPKRWCAYPLII